MKKKLLLLLLLLLCSVTATSLFAQQTITLTLAPDHPATIKLKVVADGDYSIEGVAETIYDSNKKTPYTPVAETIKIYGDILELDCASAYLTALDLSTSSKLQQLDCSLNAIKTLDLSTHADLQRIDCNSNELEELSVDYNKSLTYLDCGRNKIRSISLSCDKLEELNCGGNLLSELNLASCTSLYTIMCHQNKIKGESMKRLIDNLPLSTMEGGILVIIDTEAIGEENVCTTEQVAQLKQKQWDAYDWKGGYFEEYAGSEGIQPDENEMIFFRTGKSIGDKLSITIDGSSDISFSGLAGDPIIKGQGATEYTITDSNITISGSRITLFYCTVGEITEIDCSKAPSLTALNISSNSLTSLDLSAQEALQMLHCGINQLKQLDLVPLVNLQTLNCVQNSISAIDLTHNTQCAFLNCASNNLTELNVSSEALNTIFCYDNKIKELDLTHCPNLVRLEAFENELERIDISNCPKLELLYCGTNKLSSLSLYNNSNLKELGCGDNQIQSLDLSQQSSLLLLYATDNNLASLAISPEATQLELIDCYHNRLTGQAMESFIATIPEVSTGNYAEIYLYDSTASNERNEASPEQINKIIEKHWAVYDQNGENPIILSNDLLARNSIVPTLLGADGMLHFSGIKALTEYLLFDIDGRQISHFITDSIGSATISVLSDTEHKYILYGDGEAYLVMTN